MWKRTYYAVRTRHPVKGSRWDGQHLFRVSVDERPEGRLYYASADNFGCGKTHPTPNGAIALLAEDNGAEVLDLCIQYEEH
jgi:hypothetical protein